MTTNEKPYTPPPLPLKYRRAIFGIFAMDEDDELDRLLSEFGFVPSRDGRAMPDDGTPPRWDEDDLWNDDGSVLGE